MWLVLTSPLNEGKAVSVWAIPAPPRTTGPDLEAIKQETECAWIASLLGIRRSGIPDFVGAADRDAWLAAHGLGYQTTGKLVRLKAA